MNDEIPPHFKRFDIPMKDIDYLVDFFKAKDQGEIISFATRYLCDLVKASEVGWNSVLFKGKHIDHRYEFDPNYYYAAFKLNKIYPVDGKFMRIDAQELEERLKIKQTKL